MKNRTHVRSRLATAAVAVLAVAIFAGGGQAATTQDDRSRVLNEIYGLGDGPAVSDPAYLAALKNQADALAEAIRNGGAPATTPDDRSRVLNELYGLGDGPAVSDPAYLAALKNQADGLAEAIRNGGAPAPTQDDRSRVLNEIYGLGDGPAVSDPAYLAALKNQADALAERIRNQASPSEVVVGGGFDWADAGIGVAAAFGAVLLAGAGVLGLRRRGHVAQPDS